MALIIAGVAYFKWNKPHMNVKDADGIKITASKLYNSYSTDSTTAKASFTNKVIELSGEVAGISKNQQNQTVITVKVDSTDASVNCTLEDANTVDVKVGTAITVKGICDGYLEGDLGLAGSVIMVRCLLIK